MIYGVRPSAVSLLVGAADTVDELISFYETEEIVSQGSLLSTEEIILRAPLRQLIFVPLILSGEPDFIEEVCREHNIVLVEWTEILAHQRRLVRTVDDDAHPNYMRTPTIAERHGLAPLTDITHQTLLQSIGEGENALKMFEMRTRRVRDASLMAIDKGQIAFNHFVMYAVCEDTHPALPAGPATLAYFVRKVRFVDPNDMAEACPDEHLTELPPSFTKVQDGIFKAPDGLDAEGTRQLLLGLGYHPDPMVRACFDGVDPVAYRPREGTHYYRVDILNASVADLEAGWPQYALKAAHQATKKGVEGRTVWYVFDSHSLAARVKQASARKGWVVNGVYLVDDMNVPRKLPDGGVLNQLPETPIRPWNYRREDYALLDAEARAALHKTFKADEFICAVGAAAQGRLHVLIAPATYFARNGDLYPQSLGIDHLLPNGLKEISPGRYAAPAMPLSALQRELADVRHFKSDFLLQVKANGL